MVSPFSKFIAAIGLTASLLVACAPARSTNMDGTKNPDTKKEETAATDDPENDADILADEGESILTVDTMADALVKFDAALKLDPKNARADLWSTFIRGELELKGVATRIRPLILAQPNGYQRYDRLLAQMNVSEPSLRAFYLAGPADITSVPELQELADRIGLRLEDMRAAIARHKSQDVRLLIPRDFLGFLQTFVDPIGQNRCRETTYGPIDSGKDDCDPNKIAALFNRADFEALNFYLTNAEAELTLMNAYVVNPAALQKIEDAPKDSSSFVEYLNSLSKLRKGQNLVIAKTGLRDLALTIRYALQHKQEFCPAGEMSINSRAGHLISMGVCWPVIGDSESRIARLVDQVLAIAPATMFTDRRDNIVDLDVMKLVTDPVRDLSVIGPISTPKCQDVKMNVTPLDPYVSKGYLQSFFRTLDTDCGGQP